MNIDIRLSLEFFDHPKSKKLKKRLGIEGVMALLKLWAWTAGNRPNGMLTGLDAEAVELAADWDGEEGAFVSTLLDLRLLDDDDGTFAIHDWEDHQAYASKSEERSRRGAAGAAGKWGQAQEAQNRMTRSERLSAARKKGSHTSAEWEEMVRFFGGRCVRCGADDAAPVKDHIVPIYQGGCDSIRNLQPLCRHCNSSKGPENTDYRGDFCLREHLEMPAKWEKNACERLQNACDVCVTSGRTPAPETRNQEPETRNIYTPPLTPPRQGRGEGDVLPGETAIPVGQPECLPRVQRPAGPVKTDAPSKGHPEWPAFLSCWELWPVKQGQEEAWCEWMRLHNNGTLAPCYVIREAIARLLAEDSRWARGMVPRMAKWLHGKGWNDEPYMQPGQGNGADVVSPGNTPRAPTEFQKRQQEARGMAAAALAARNSERKIIETGGGRHEKLRGYAVADIAPCRV